MAGRVLSIVTVLTWPLPFSRPTVCKYPITLLPLKFFMNVLLPRSNLAGFAKTYINHKDHQEHKESHIIMETSFVTFVYFVVNLYSVVTSPFGQQPLKPGKTVESVPHWLSVHG